MNTISKKQISAAVKAAYAAAKIWCKCGYDHYSPIRIDLNNGQIWASEESSSHWIVYDDDAVQLLGGYNLRYTADELRAAYTDEAIKLLTAAGWTVED